MKTLPRTIEPRQEAIDTLHARVFGKPKTEHSNSNRQNGHHLSLEDDVLLKKAFAAKNGSRIKALYEGDISEYPSSSEADLALCSLLAFYTEEEAQLDRLFRDSKLYREKWDEKHYGDGRTHGQATVEKALAGNRQHYGGENRTNGTDHDPIADSIAPLDDLAENDSPAKVEAALRKLILTVDGVDPLRRATIKEASIRKLKKIGVSAPAKLVDAAFQMEKDGTPDQQQGRPVLFDDPEPCPDVVDGAVLLDDITATLKRFVVLPPHAAEAIALWILHACALVAFVISPLLVFNSSTMRSGKTLTLEIISYLLVKCLFASNITPATLFRVVDKYTPCLLIDEADTFLRDNDELRGILNASHRKASAYVMRTVGDEHEPAMFVTWCAKAIALIGKLPGTLEDRSILIPMRRRGPGERVKRFRSDKMGPELETLKRKIMRWIADNLGGLSKADPEAPCELNDRAMDNWRPLLAVAELAGGAWPGKSQAAARALSGAVDEGANSAAIQLLADLKALFSERDTDRLSSADICEVLGTMEDRPWPEWKRGKPITTRQLAKLLGGFDVIPKTIRTGDGTAKGYTLEQLIDPFSRYLPSPSVTTAQPAPGLELRAISDPSQKGAVTDEKTELSPCNIKDVTDVTDRNTLFLDFEGGGSEKPKKWTQNF